MSAAIRFDDVMAMARREKAYGTRAAAGGTARVSRRLEPPGKHADAAERNGFSRSENFVVTKGLPPGERSAQLSKRSFPVIDLLRN
jgi:hypothetical protein